MDVERPDVDRRGRLLAEAEVPCLCMFILFETEDCREWEEEGTRECPKPGGIEGEAEGEFRKGGGGMVPDEAVRECLWLLMLRSGRTWVVVVAVYCLPCRSKLIGGVEDAECAGRKGREEVGAGEEA